MKFISKLDFNPQYLETWVTKRLSILKRLSGNDQWDKVSTGIKRKLQRQLLNEQGYLCAYCNRPIHAGEDPKDDLQLRIDHVEPKAGYPDPQLITFNYKNLVGTCFGNERGGLRPIDAFHCDKEKKDAQLHEALDPTKRIFESELIVAPTGRIISRSGNSEIIKCIEEILNLNHDGLIKEREAILRSYVNRPPLLPEAIKKINDYETKIEMENVENKTIHCYEPFSGILILYLKEYISRHPEI